MTVIVIVALSHLFRLRLLKSPYSLMSIALLCGGFFCRLRGGKLLYMKWRLCGERTLLIELKAETLLKADHPIWTFYRKTVLPNRKILEFFHCNLSNSMVH